ncbi:DsbE family thiol:disulfide interchange protein [Thiohalobacter sp.]|uniref:DsbE family thiol:disulfide interchange protein n=1 Tax=Thiohalobacter sp. TaxID=2025948 RepID=UPI00261BF774|nr:DsbE family thiol:disulfide interchange protein [Thiohalobacter sp.]
MKQALPLGIFLALVAVLAVGLRLDPAEVPSPLIGKPAPGFELPALQAPEAKVRPADFLGEVWLLNVWASWCAGCQVEHPVLMALAEQGHLSLVGMAYKDDATAAEAWLQARGNPYRVVAMDTSGQAGIDWGVYGVPETFVIDARGVVRHKHIGPLTRQALREDILPLVERLRTEAGGP